MRVKKILAFLLTFTLTSVTGARSMMVIVIRNKRDYPNSSPKECFLHFSSC